MSRTLSLFAALSLLPGLGLSAETYAQAYPSRPVRLIVATVPGGGTDAIARILGSKLSELLGQQFVVAKLNTAILSALRVPDVREQMARQGLDPIGSSPAEFAAHLQRETTKWARVIKDAGIKAD